MVRVEKTTMLINIEIKIPLSWAALIPRRTVMLAVLKERALARENNSPIISRPSFRNR